MLVTAAAMGEDLDTYYKPEHPVQQRILHMIGEICEYDPQKIIMGTDGCGVPVHALPLRQFAYGVARMAHPESLGEKMGAEAARITAAMGKYPLIMSGTGRIDARLMEKYDRLFCKSGADGYYIVGDRKEGIGIAVKIDSGNGQARNAVVVEVLRQLGIISQEDLAEFADTHTPKMRNHKQEGACVPSSLCTRHNQRDTYNKVRGRKAPDLVWEKRPPCKRAGREKCGP